MQLTPLCLAALGLLAAGCGDGIVAVDSTVATPYEGPMYVEPDHRDRASVLARSGAAGLALECDHAPGSGGGGNYDTGPETVGSDATEGLEDWLEESGVVAPAEGFVVEREEGDRVLFSYDVDDETKFAAIASGAMRGEGGDTGWGVEAWAQCDAAELPESVTDEWGTQVWEKDGRRVPVSRIQSHDGPEHCDWQDVVFLDLGEYPDGTQYLRDVEGELTGSGLIGSFDDGVALPDDARDTGYEYGDWHLWLAADESAAYVVSIENPDEVERWPGAKDYIHCA